MAELVATKTAGNEPKQTTNGALQEHLARYVISSFYRSFPTSTSYYHTRNPHFFFVCLLFTIRWVELVDIAVGHPNPSVARTEAIMTFCRSFVPADVTEDDVAHFSGNLASDEEYFVAMQRELRQVLRSSLLSCIYLEP